MINGGRVILRRDPDDAAGLPACPAMAGWAWRRGPVRRADQGYSVLRVTAMSQTGAAPMRSAPHLPRGAVAGPDPGDEPFALLDFALGQALGADWGRGYLGEVLARYAAASGGRAALLLRLPPGREPVVLAAFPSSAADPALVTAVNSMLAGHLAGGAGGGCVEGPLALPHQLATAGSPDWAAIRPVRVLAACARPDTVPAAGRRGPAACQPAPRRPRTSLR